MLAGKAYAGLRRHYVIVPAVHDHDGSHSGARGVLLVAGLLHAGPRNADAPDTIVPPQKAALEQIKNKKGYSEYGWK